MVKKALISVAAAAFIFCGIASLSNASEMGPAEMTLTTINSTAKTPKPSFFPHKTHQDALACADCHHGMADGKQVPFAEGQEIGKCESCHNKEVLAGKTAGKEKLDTFQGAAHANCKVCHTEIAAKDETKKSLKSCKTCHKA